MPVPELLSDTGLLPLGRYECTESEVRRVFVEGNQFSSSRTRADIWDDWETARDIVTAIIPVYSVWFAGSFTTSKLDPGDIDVVFVTDACDFDNLNVEDKKVIAAFATGSKGAASHGLQVDSYMLQWKCIPQPAPRLNDEDSTYFLLRGYWDDFWLRSRTGVKGAAAVSADAIPRRGYLEVSYRGYPS